STRFLSNSIPSGVQHCLRSLSPKIVSGFIPAAASWAETVLTKRLLRFEDISLNTGIRSRMRSRPCTTSRPAGGEAGCLASHSTTQEPTSSKSAMDACHGSTRSSTSNCCFLEGRIDWKTIPLAPSIGSIDLLRIEQYSFGREDGNGYHLTRLFRSAQRGSWKAAARAVPHCYFPRLIRRADATRGARSVGIYDRRRH